jgi:hypothetical protein
MQYTLHGGIHKGNMQFQTFTGDINGVAIVHHVSGCMLDTVIFSSGHKRMIIFVFEWKDNQTLFLISR